MTGFYKVAALGMLLSASVTALADDSPTDAPVKSPRQKMHECVSQQKAANPSMARADLRKTCAAQLKTQEDHPSVPASPTNAPQH